MKNFAKKALALVVVLTVLATSMVVTAAPAKAATSAIVQANLDKMLDAYFTGSYFSANGKACDMSAGTHATSGAWGACDNCKLQNIPSRMGLPAGSALSDGGTWTCLAFAKYAFYVLNSGVLAKDSRNTRYEGISYKDVYLYASLGDYIYYSGHGGIFITGDSSGYYMYEANYEQPTNIVSYGTKKHTQGPCNIIHAYNYSPVPVDDCSISFSNMSHPTSQEKGAGQYMSGTITSKYTIKTIEAYFINASTGAEISTPTRKTISPNATSVDVLSKVDPVLYFAQLPEGTWKLVYKVTDIYGYSKSHTTVAFIVGSSSSSISFSNMPTIPDIPYKQGYYTTSGTITSNYSITKVEAHFVYASTGAQASKPASQTVSLSGTSIDVPSQVDQVLYFASLAPGQYKLVLTATNSKGTSNTWTSNAFWITEPACECSTSVAGWYRVASTGLNINSGHNYESYIGEMPPYALCWVSKGSLSSATYYHVTYQNLQGISSRNYLTKLNSFTLSFNDNGGSGGPGSVTVWDGVSDFSYGEGDYTSVTVPYRNNYFFEGYYTAASGGTQVYNAYGRITNEGTYWSGGAYVKGSGATLYAHWRIKTVYATSVSLSPRTLTLTIGQSADLTATVLPAEVTNGAVNWFVDDPQVASITPGARNANISHGTVVALSPGSTTVKVMTTDDTNLVDACTINVLPILVDEIILTPEATELNAGQFINISATVLPANATNRQLIWSSSDETIASVEYGLVQSYGPGVVTITARAADGSGVSASVALTVRPVVPDFEISPHSTVMADKDLGSRFAIGVSPADARDQVVWSSSAPGVAVVDADGVVSAVGPGRAVITAEIPYGPSDSCVVQVKSDLSLMALPADLETIGKGAFRNLTADRVVIRDACTSIGQGAFAGGDLLFALIPPTVTEIADDAFSGSDSLCIVCAAGSAAETFARTKGIRYVIDAEASFVGVRAVTMPSSLTLEIEDTAALNATVTPANASNPTLQYVSSDEDVAAVSADGVVTGISPGKAVITAAAVDGSGKSASCTVTVTLPNVSVSLAGSETFQSGDEISALLHAQLTLTGAAAQQVQQIGFLLYDAEDHRIGISMMDPAQGGGLTFECDTAGDMNVLLAPTTQYRWRCMVIVKGMSFNSNTLSFTTPALPPRIVLSSSSLLMKPGDSVVIQASVLYSQETEVLWNTSNSSVAMVVDGEIIARAAGTATITARLASDPTVKATCQVTVSASTASNAAITLNATALTLAKGETTRLEAAVTPPPVNLMEWRSSDTDIAVVDGNGAVTALNAGRAVIYVRTTNPDLEASCQVTVLPNLVEEIRLSQQSVSLAVGETQTLSAEALPLSADDRTVIWSCGESAVAEVEDGTIRGLAPGTAQVMASAIDGSGVTASCAVTVYSPVVSCNCETKYAGYYEIARTNGTGLAISSGHGASDAAGNTELGLIPEGTEVYISRASGPAGQSGCWGHVTYEGVSGYCAMYYVDPVYRVDTSVENVNAAKLQAVIDRANAWADYVWTAPVDIPVYNNDFDDPENAVAYHQYFWYPAGTQMHGVPYTLASSKYRMETYEALSAASKGTATNFTYGGWLMWGPKYGGDCTCLVNDVLWTGDPTLPHDGQVYMTKKAYLYSNPSWDDLAPGDALANSGHAMIVIGVNGDDVTIVESRGNGSTVGAIHCQNMTPREGGGYYVCGTCAYCNGANKCGAIRRTVKKATLIGQGYSVARYKPLYTD